MQSTMRIEFLGSGGATSTPRPGCQCRVCVEARERGVPYSRGGPALFVHGPDVLIDTPDDIAHLLNRAAIEHIGAGLYSHWHPDHTMGRRVWESLNVDFRHWPPSGGTTDVYLPEQVALDFGRRLGLREHFDFMTRQGYVRVHTIPDGDLIELSGVRITPFRLAEDYVYAFIFEAGTQRVLIAPDELFGWEPPSFTRGVDLAILPTGIFEHDPLTGERKIAADHPVLRFEATFAQTLDMLRAIQPRRAILTHVEEQDGYSHDDLLAIAAALRTADCPIEFAYDGLVVDVG